MVRRTLATVPLLTALVAAAALGACSSDDDGADGDVKPADGPDLSAVEFEDETGSTDVGVDTRDNTFVPAYIEVKAGTTVTFTNVGRTEHNVYPVEEGAFTPIEADALAPEGEASLTFDEPGDVPYYCTLHGTTTKGMVGAIRVVE